jgi:hypothetical protein
MDWLAAAKVPAKNAAVDIINSFLIVRSSER